MCIITPALKGSKITGLGHTGLPSRTMSQRQKKLREKGQRKLKINCCAARWNLQLITASWWVWGRTTFRTGPSVHFSLSSSNTRATCHNTDPSTVNLRKKTQWQNKRRQWKRVCLAPWKRSGAHRAAWWSHCATPKLHKQGCHCPVDHPSYSTVSPPEKMTGVLRPTSPSHTECSTDK